MLNIKGFCARTLLALTMLLVGITLIPLGQARPPASSPPSPAASTSRARVTLLPLGPFPKELLPPIAQALTAELQVQVSTAPPVPLPAAAYFPPRKRYRADKLLDLIPALVPKAPSDQHFLGLTQVDISTTKAPHEDWGVFGLGELNGRTCVVSSFRLKRNIKDQAHFTFRLTNVSVHEVGHTLGLEHCTEERCVMLDAEGGITNTDTSTGHLGPACRARLERFHPLP